MNRSMFWGIAAALVAVVGCESTTSSTADVQAFGHFEGDVVASWDADGRNMTLREPFVYVDGQNRRWVAPAGEIVNGASIPAAFWTIIGGPFEGQYRNASVVHDVGCAEMTASWEDVHRMFYEACRCGGVKESEAKMLYYAVYHFGPRWQPVTEQVVQTQQTSDGQVVEQEVTVQKMVRTDPPPPTPTEIEQVADYVTEENPSAEAMKTFTRANLHNRKRPIRGDGTPGTAWQRTRDGQPSWNHPAHSNPAEVPPAELHSESSTAANDLPQLEPTAAEPNLDIPAEPQFAGPANPSAIAADNGPALDSPIADAVDPATEVAADPIMPPPTSLAREHARPGPRMNGNEPREDIANERFAQGPVRPYGGYRREVPAEPVSPAEQQSLMAIVDQYITEQAGEPRPANYLIERTRTGFGVQIQFLHANEAGEMVPTDGGHAWVRLSRQGEVLEFKCGE